ncbi:hypothetical protein GCM10009665_22450 [Kitasatospora nipponensis]|uniref:Helix-turn-helix protein n=1 Tax=Kitasatospora nipponensis TaxID=258049 RepID=A0ABN1W1X1_9ACTN
MTRELPTATLPDHPVRVALLDLLARTGSVTSTEAARELGYSSGLCSFHLRQLARQGLIEEARARSGGRARPWRLRWDPARPPGDVGPSSALDRELEDASYRQWTAHRDRAPAPWQRDEAFSAVLHLTPKELAEVAAVLRTTLAGYEHGDARRPGVQPVAAVVRLFPLLEPDAGAAAAPPAARPTTPTPASQHAGTEPAIDTDRHHDR